MFVRIVAPVRAGETRVGSLRALVRVVHELNVSYLLANPRTPSLYTSGVVYDREPPEVREEFCTIPAVIAQGWGDCDDLAPWRSAELVVREGIEAWPDVIVCGPGLFHIIVQRRDGKREDPSRILGM